MATNVPSSLISRTFSSTTTLLPRTTRRHESSLRRHQKRHKMQPMPSYSDRSTPRDHIIFNPPSAAPNPFHTPMKFLPPTDTRRKFYESTSLQSVFSDPNPIARTGTQTTSTTTPINQSSFLPPLLSRPYEKSYHLTREDMDEMKRLRAEDPVTNSTRSLARKYGCKELFVSMVTETSEEYKEKKKQEYQDAVRRWGRKKREAMEDRAKRHKMWQRDQ